MKIVKDSEGYYVLDARNNKVNLRYQGKVVQKLPSLEHIALCYWSGNERYNTQSFDTVVMDHIDKFKCVKYYIAEELNCSQDDLYNTVKRKYPEEFI